MRQFPIAQGQDFSWSVVTLSHVLWTSWESTPCIKPYHNRMSLDTKNLATLLLGSACLLAMSVACLGHISLEPWSLHWDVSPSDLRYSGPTWTGDGARLVFDHNFGVYVIDVTGSNSTKWVPERAPKDETFAYDLSHDFEPTTSRIAFATTRHGARKLGSFEIATAQLDRSGYRRLTNNEGQDLSPSWSPDGTQITFVSNRGSQYVGQYELYMMESDGPQTRKLIPGVFVTPDRPLWSPDGDYIAFRSGPHLYVLDLDGRKAALMGETSIAPAWSPNSAWIAFGEKELSGDIVESESIVISRPNGSGRRTLMRFKAERHIPVSFGSLSWSNDGSTLRFSARAGPRTLQNALYEVEIDGSGERQIAKIDTGARVEWSPDETKIAVSQVHVPRYHKIHPQGDTLVYVSSPDGSEKQVLVKQGHDGPEAVFGK